MYWLKLKIPEINSKFSQRRKSFIYLFMYLFIWGIGPTRKNSGITKSTIGEASALSTVLWSLAPWDKFNNMVLRDKLRYLILGNQHPITLGKYFLFSDIYFYLGCKVSLIEIMFF